MKSFLRDSISSFLFEVWYLRRDLTLFVWKFEFDQISSTKHAWRTNLNWMRNCQLSRALFVRSFSFFRFLHTHRDLLISSRTDRWNFLCEIRLFHFCSKSDIFVEVWSFLFEDSNSIKSRARNMREEQISIECEIVSYFELEACAKNRF